MTEPMLSKFAVWLTPAPSDRRWISKVIQDFAAEYSAPIFEPHLTVYSGVYGPEEGLEPIVTKATASLSPLTLQVTGLNYTKEFLKTGFIVFATSDRLIQLSKDIRDRLQMPMDYTLEPHLSLIYKDIPLDQKRMAMLRFIVSIATVTFDTVTVMTPSDKGWDDVLSWTELDRHTLNR
jgi:Cyclic phosphodiesterase-like protein